MNVMVNNLQNKPILRDKLIFCFSIRANEGSRERDMEKTEQIIGALKRNGFHLINPTYGYTFYRENGVSKEETFNCITTINNQKWNVKEAELPSKSVLNIQEALLTSNNNAFINAANKIGMNNVLKFIASLLNKEESNIHPSSILGATSDGISLFELTKLYADFFLNNDDPFKNKCKQLLCQIAKIKLGIDINNLFLKTGTTNGNKERFAILGNEKIVLGIMRQENSINDYSKDGSFINSIKNIARNIFSQKKMYTWM